MTLTILSATLSNTSHATTQRLPSPRHHYKARYATDPPRNTNYREGFCNGTIMIFDTLINNKLLRCTIAATLSNTSHATTQRLASPRHHSKARYATDPPRNTNYREGFCNGTRIIFDTMINNKLLRCTIAGLTDKYRYLFE